MRTVEKEERKMEKEVFVPHLIGVVDGDPRALTDDVPGNQECRGGTFAVVFNCYDAFDHEDPELSAEGEREAEATAAEMAHRWNAHTGMLESLEYMVANIGQPACLETRDGFAKARVAIAKAKGEA